MAERRATIRFVDLKQRPMALGEIKRFIDRFGLNKLIDAEGKAYIEAGLKYLKLSDSELLTRIEANPQTAPPSTRARRQAPEHSYGEESWKAMLA